MYNGCCGCHIFEDFEDCNISPQVAKIILGIYGICAIGVFYNVVNMLCD